MKIIFISCILIMFSSLAQAKRVKAKNRHYKNLKQEMSFNGSMVNGQYQFLGEATATVENDKLLEDLLGVPKNFKQRNKRMKARY